jgi:hypothetical protein
LTIYAAQKLFLSSVIKVMCVAQNMCSIWIWFRITINFWI